MPEDTPEQIWSAVRAEVDRLEQRLTAQYQSSLASIQAILVALGKTSELDARAAELGSLNSLKNLVEGPGQRLLYEPIRILRRERPAERALEALENHATAIEDLVRRLPEVVVLGGPELTELLSPWAKLGIHGYLIRRRTRIELPLRQIALLHFSADLNRRAPLDAECLLILAQAEAMLIEPWQDYRRQALLYLSRRTVDPNELVSLQKRWTRRVDVLTERSDRHMQTLQKWAGASIHRLARAIATRSRKGGDDRHRVLQPIWQQYFHFWSRQQRAVKGSVDLEWESTSLLMDAFEQSRQSLTSLDKEQAELLSELESGLLWLGQASAGPDISEMPPALAQFVSAEDRVGAWARSIQGAVGRRLSSTVETVEPTRALPGWREPWRRLEPAKEFISTLEHVALPIVNEGFREAEGEHRAVIRAIERARQVVQFSAESAANTEGGAQIAQEGLSNALSLIKFQRESISDPHPRVERALAEGLATSFLFVHLRLEQHRLGFLTQLLRQSGSRAGREIWNGARYVAAGSGRWMKRFASGLYHWMLQKVGWEAPPAAVSAAVASRGYLSDVLSLQLGARDLPMIYRRLFRLAPVEDPRFLVGREAEMSELALARDLWLSNRSVAVVLVGERGSGKTSILNCLIARELSDVGVIRGQFSKRVASPADVRGFVHDLLDLPADQDLQQALLAKKRIILIEELERTFLRRMNGFDGLQELLSIVSQTCRTTLWILSLNQMAFQYLNAAIGLEKYFSHRINAMSIAPSQLKNAILLRHNLSGLRLHFPTVREDASRFGRVRRVLGLEPAADERFFDSLFRQSGGVFRSAFELWQHYMDRVEGGVLYMRQPVQPDFEPLLAELRESDLFTLQAILQHGSLTLEEHSEIFELSPSHSRVQLERLENLECLEADPAGPGLRIRPEAGRLVRIALTRHNLF